MHLLVCLAVSATLVAFIASANAGVLGIDYGAQWFKVALVKRGSLMEIVLNRESKRKTASLVSIRSSQRLFGSDATNLATRFPRHTYQNLKSLLGRLYDDHHSSLYRSLAGNGMLSHSNRSTVTFEHSEANAGKGMVFAVEELVGMQLQHAREQAEIMAKESCTEAVITVPPFFNQFERQAILDAAQLAGIQVLALIHDETAVAINYALGRSFDQAPQYHIFYDMGAGSTTTALVKFNSSKSITQIDVLAVGHDRTLGGDTFDAVLYRYLLDKFTTIKSKQLKKPLKSNPRSVVKLWREAGRVKHILSANTDTQAAIEQLHEDHDFRTKITRVEFETQLLKDHNDMIARITEPIHQVLKSAELSLENITSIILVGGGVRVPIVQTALKTMAGEDKLAQNVNGDEAAVMGAVFRAAGLSLQFRVKEVRVRDITPYAIAVEHARVTQSDVSIARTITTRLFPRNAALDNTKYLTFRRSLDFGFIIKYIDLTEDEIQSFGPTEILHVQVNGLTQLLEKHKDTMAVGLNPEIRVAVKLDASGLVAVTKIEAHLKISKTAKGAEGGSIKGTKGDDQQQQQDDVSAADTADGAKRETPDPNSKTEATVAVVNETVTEKFPLTFTTTPQSIVPMSQEDKTVSLKRTEEWDRADRAQRIREEARNGLEGFIYSAREKIYESVHELVSTIEERTQVIELLKNHGEWLEETGDADSTTTDHFRTRLTELKKLFEPIQRRVQEYNDRPSAIQLLKEATEAAQQYLSLSKNIPSTERGATDEDLGLFEHVYKETKQWGESAKSALEKLKPHEESTSFSAKEFFNRGKSMMNEIQRLVKKPKPIPKPKPVIKTKKVEETQTETGTETGKGTEIDTENDTKTESKDDIKSDTTTDSSTLEEDKHGNRDHEEL